MKNGLIEQSDADTLMSAYRKIDIYGNTKEPLTTEEQVLIFCIAKSIQDGRIKISPFREMNCGDCKWKGKRHQKCSCCIRNSNMKDCYED